jgi:hypothetical protein
VLAGVDAIAALRVRVVSLRVYGESLAALSVVVSEKKSCPVWATWPPLYLLEPAAPPTCALRWMCVARPWYQPG